MSDITTNEIYKTRISDNSSLSKILESHDIVKEIIKNNVDVNVKNNSRRTLLHEAVMITHDKIDNENNVLLLKIIKTLLEEGGADPNILDNQKYPPLYYSLTSLSSLKVKLLIENGAKVDWVDSNGCSPLYIVCTNKGNLEISV